MITLPRKFNKRGSCFNCGKHGYFKRDCPWPEASAEQSKGKKRSGKHKANKVTEELEADNTSGSSESLVVEHEVLSVGWAINWIVDSGATCHMCNGRSMFVVYRSLEIPERVTLGDGCCLDAINWTRTVVLVMKLPGRKKQRCKLREVLFIPDLLYSLLSVSQAGKMTKFSESGCQIVNADNKVIACASRCGSLYMLECECCDHAYAALTKEDVWHHWYGHLGAQDLRQLAVEGLVEGFDYDVSKKVSFCEPCTEGNHH